MRNCSVRGLIVVIMALAMSCSAHQNRYWSGRPGGNGSGDPQVGKLLARVISQAASRKYLEPVRILYPCEGAVFPADIASPLIEWEDIHSQATAWLVTAEAPETDTFAILTRQCRWAPSRNVWEDIKKGAGNNPVRLSVYGLKGSKLQDLVSRQSVEIKISSDPVANPILFRQVPPFFSVGRHHPRLVKWRLGDVSSYDPPATLMEKQSICGSCHTASADGRLLGMDLDFRKDKGAYALMPIKPMIRLTEKNFISWNSMPNRDRRPSTGLYSRISPSGRYVVSTVNEISLLIMIDDPYCSQLFFPLRGKLAIYDIDARRFQTLPGADDPHYVQTAPEWSPDEKYILFSRVKKDDALIESFRGRTIFSSKESIETLNKRYPVHFDICRLPFNQGQGGVAEPVAGASGNGMSNYYPRFSPDGKWIVFTRSRTGLVIQPDAQLYIMPAAGGRPRKMICNIGRTISWHSWSPNGRWIVFISKVNTPCTELFLAHVDRAGRSSPPVRLWRFSDKDLAANVPEFINIHPGMLRNIRLAGN